MKLKIRQKESIAFEAEEQISDQEDKIVEITTAEQIKEKRMKRIEDSLDRKSVVQGKSVDLGGRRIIKKKREREKERDNQVQEIQRVPYRINPRKNTPRHILIKPSKIKYKEKILKAAREKQQITYKGIPIRLTADVSAETLQARRESQDI